MKKHPEITEATKRAFVDALVILRKKKRIEKISVKELTDAAGYNRTTFYNYFKDIYDLSDYFQEYVFENIRGQLEDNLLHINDRNRFARNVANICCEWREYLLLVLDNIYSSNFLDKIKNTVIQYWISEFGLTDDIKTNYKIDFYVSATMSVMRRWLKNPSDMTTEEISDILIEMMTNPLSEALNLRGKTSL